MESLVSTEWLASHLDDRNLRLFDVTVTLKPNPPGSASPYEPVPAHEEYEAGHIPGAAFLDIHNDLSDHSKPTHFMMPDAQAFAAALGKAGVGQDSFVVAYSTQTNPMWATRLWWMLRSCGFDNCAVLDGGFSKWKAEGRVIAAGRKSYPPATLTLSPRAGAWADKKDVLAAIGQGGVCTINALSPELHSGAAERNYGRKGHIKGSVNVPYASVLNPDGTFRSDADMRESFAPVGAMGKDKVILYCGGGISATVDALALTKLGHKAVAVYDGSMSEWSNDPAMPMETGA